MKQKVLFLLVLLLGPSCNYLPIENTPTIVVSEPTRPTTLSSTPTMVTELPTLTPVPVPKVTLLPVVPTPTLSLLPSGEIAFAARHSGEAFQIYVVEADGTGLRVLVQGEGEDHLNPLWSPDGAKLVFEVFPTDSEFSHDLWVVNADGTDRTQLTQAGAEDCCASWSPDGQWLAYVSYQDFTQGLFDSTLYAVRADGSKVIQLTDGKALDAEPSWSPKGNQIAFSSDRTGSSEIYVMDSDGSKVQRLTHDGRGNRSPIWSPDGQQLAFLKESAPLSAELWVIGVDGADAQRVSEGLTVGNPYWHPSGTHLSFDGDDALRPETSARNVFSVQLPGLPPLKLTNINDGEGYAFNGPWSGDGRFLIVEMGVSTGDLRLYLLADNGTVIGLLNAVDLGVECCGAWRPDP